MAPSSTPWDELKIEELRRLWAAGYSASEIAHKLGRGITRMAVLGKVNRLGLERRKVAQPRKPRDQTVKRGRPIVRRPVFISPPPPQQQQQQEQPPAVDERKWHEAPDMRKLQLLMLRDHHCRAPIGDPQGYSFYFCAADRKDGDPYCAFHMRRAFARTREQARRALEGAGVKS